MINTIFEGIANYFYSKYVEYHSQASIKFDKSRIAPDCTLLIFNAIHIHMYCSIILNYYGNQSIICILKEYYFIES